MTIATGRFCPVCSGPWLYGLTFRHAMVCLLRDLDDGTVAADYERVAWRRYAFRRPATATEQTLAIALGWTAPVAPADPSTPQPAVWTVVIPRTSSIRRRIIQADGGPSFDPDAPVAYAVTVAVATASALVTSS